MHIINFNFFDGVYTPKRKVSDNGDLLSCEAHLDKYFSVYLTK